MSTMLPPAEGYVPPKHENMQPPEKNYNVPSKHYLPPKEGPSDYHLHPTRHMPPPFAEYTMPVHGQEKYPHDVVIWGWTNARK